LQRSHEALQHSAYFFRVCNQRLGFFDGNDLDSSTDLQLGLKFVVRAVCVQEMVNVFARVMTTEAL